MTAWPATSSAVSAGLLVLALIAGGSCAPGGGDAGREEETSPPRSASTSSAPADPTAGMAGELGPYSFALPPMPEGTVARSGGEPPLPEDPRALISPLAGTAAARAQGRALFQVYCAPCHGPAGYGDGPMAGLLGVTVRDLGDETAAGLADGEIYATITRGSGQMLGLRGLIAPADRWRIVLGMREVVGMRAAERAGASAGDSAAAPGRGAAAQAPPGSRP